MTDLRPASSSHATVLVADDEPSICLLMRVTLEAEGYAVIEAHDGPTALELARTHRPDIVLLDVMMPGRTGLQVAEDLRDECLRRGVPILFVTAQVTFNDVIRGFEAGALHYLSKPFVPSELVERVRSSLEEARNGQLERVRIARVEKLWSHTLKD